MSRTAAATRSVTIRDVAARAHASAGTVSRVLNGAPNVKEAVRRRVEAAIHELQYVPNAQARALSSNAFHTIAAVIPTIRNLNFVIFVRALQEALAREGYTLLFSAHEFDMRLELEEVRAFLARGLDGVVLVGQEHLPELYAALAQRRCPYVTTWTLPRAQESDCVGVDNFDAAARLTRYLLDLGHREFARGRQPAAVQRPQRPAPARRESRIGRGGHRAAGRPRAGGRRIDRGGQACDPATRRMAAPADGGDLRERLPGVRGLAGVQGPRASRFPRICRSPDSAISSSRPTPSRRSPPCACRPPTSGASPPKACCGP